MRKSKGQFVSRCSTFSTLGIQNLHFFENYGKWSQFKIKFSFIYWSQVYNYLDECHRCEQKLFPVFNNEVFHVCLFLNYFTVNDAVVLNFEPSTLIVSFCVGKALIPSVHGHVVRCDFPMGYFRLS